MYTILGTLALTPVLTTLLGRGDITTAFVRGDATAPSVPKALEVPDGSRSAFWVVPGNSSDWQIFISGGGRCLDDGLCEARASTSALGSSIGYNISGAWGPTAANCTRVYLPYCDPSF